jgi:DNA-binding FadR family transcriptional regulator
MLDATHSPLIDGIDLRAAPRAAFRPVKAGNTFEQTVERLMQAIKLGAVASGDRLPAERELARLLNVSRVTLREAIRALQDAGYVESRRGRSGGTFVRYDAARRRSGGDARRMARKMGAELSDALDLRLVVEPGAAELAARRRLSSAERGLLMARLEAVKAASVDGHRVADSRLHLTIAELSGAPSVAAACTEVQTRLDDLLAAIPVLARNIEHSHAQHAAVVRAIVAGNRRKARESMVEHVEATSALLRGFLA